MALLQTCKLATWLTQPVPRSPPQHTRQATSTIFPTYTQHPLTVPRTHCPPRQFFTTLTHYTTMATTANPCPSVPQRPSKNLSRPHTVPPPHLFSIQPPHSSNLPTIRKFHTNPGTAQHTTTTTIPRLHIHHTLTHISPHHVHQTLTTTCQPYHITLHKLGTHKLSPPRHHSTAPAYYSKHSHYPQTLILTSSKKYKGTQAHSTNPLHSSTNSSLLIFYRINCDYLHLRYQTLHPYYLNIPLETTKLYICQYRQVPEPPTASHPRTHPQMVHQHPPPLLFFPSHTLCNLRRNPGPPNAQQFPPASHTHNTWTYKLSTPPILSSSHFHTSTPHLIFKAHPTDLPKHHYW